MSARLRSLILPAVLTLLALAVLVSLGNWQVRRLAWKEGLIARVEERPRSEAVDLRIPGRDESADSGAFLDENEYRPVLLRGEYQPEREARVFTSLTRPRGQFGGPGYWVLTPLLTPSGETVFVNRGFVPDAHKDDYDPPPAGSQTVRGLIRAPETGNAFTPDPKLDERIFFARDPARIALALGPDRAQDNESAAPVMPFFVDLDASFTPASGLPQAGETRISFPNDHLQYAVTWYGLAAALLAVFAVFVQRRLNEPQTGRLTQPGQHP